MITRRFSHIYIEEAILDSEVIRRICTSFPNAQQVPIGHYKDVFCRKRQDFRLQKRTPKLILAMKRPPFLYSGSANCDSFGNHSFYYTSSMMNCPYDCAYCYLKGMYPSANLVIFVNQEEIFEEVDKRLAAHPLYLCISYDTDLLSFEPVTGFVDSWMKFASRRPDLFLEIRTKCAFIRPFLSRPALRNVIVAWTLSPEYVIKNYEMGTPNLAARIRSIKAVMKAGWQVRICIDPVLFIDNYREDTSWARHQGTDLKVWERIYQGFLDKVFMSLDGDRLTSVSIGAFRMAKDYLKRTRRRYPCSRILHYPFKLNRNGVYCYPPSLENRILGELAKYAARFVPLEKIRIFTSSIP